MACSELNLVILRSPPSATPFHSLPVLTWDGEVIGQSMTIARFLAKKVGLDGKTDLEQAKCDAIVDQCVDVFPGMISKKMSTNMLRSCYRSHT